MRVTVEDLEVNYVEHGAGTAVIGLHGAGVDHREIEAWMEPIFADRDDYRRIYPDLPGMGHTAAADQLRSNDDVISALLALIDQLTPHESFLVVGHSYGGYLARAIAAHRRDRAVGLALVCPIGDSTRDLPPHEVMHTEPDAYDELPADQVEAFDDYFVIRTSATARRYRDAVAPGVALVDENGLERIFANWALTREPQDDDTYRHPTLILAGRQDSTAGYASAGDLLPLYPHATSAVIDGAGHALPHEQPQVVAYFIGDWLTRTRRRAAPRTVDSERLDHK